MKLRLALAAATCLALPLVAHAQPVTGPYVSGEGGTSILNPQNFKITEPEDFDESYGASGKTLYNNSYAADAAIGFGFGNGFRVQLDGDYIRNTAHKLVAQNFSESGEPSANFDEGYTESARIYGRENKYGPMVNLLYDFDAGLPVFPYVGAGVGYQFIQDKFGLGLNKGIGEQESWGGDKGSVAIDAIVGASFPLAMVPGLSLTAEYRFMYMPATYKFNATVLGGIPEGTTGSDSIKIGPESSHTFMVGMRYQLFPPPVMAPAPAAAAAPMAAPAAPAKTYLVFFDWDKSSLTPRATEIISEAASDSKTTGVTTLDVSGYTDTSGTPVYNQGLSERRAKAVAAQLVADGVPAGEIETHAYGETHLLVPTGPGVREPQNRRVEIVLD